MSLRRHLSLALVAALTAGGCASPDAAGPAQPPAAGDASESRRSADAGGAATAPVASGRLTLDDAVKLALLYNKELQAAVQGVAAARGRVREAEGQA